MAFYLDCTPDIGGNEMTQPKAQKPTRKYSHGFQDGFDHAVTNVELWFKSQDNLSLSIQCFNETDSNPILESLLKMLRQKKLESERVNSL